MQPVTGGPGTPTITPFASLRHRWRPSVSKPNHGATVAADFKALITELNRDDGRWPPRQPELLKYEQL